MASPFDNIPGKIFIGGISPLTTQDTIQKYFEKYGELCDCVLMQDKGTGKSRGFGFVTYKDPYLVDEVLKHNHVIDGKEVDCKRAIPRDQQGETTKEESSGGGGGGSYKTKKLFVGGLPQSTTEDQFKEYFEQFGKVEDSVIMVDKDTGKSRGFGFVTFDNEDSVERVIAKYYDNKIDGKWVECKKAQPKDQNQGSSKRGGGRHDRGHYSRGGDDYHQDHPRGGYYRDQRGETPQKSQKYQSTQDSYGGYYGSGYTQNQMRNNYDNASYSNYNPQFSGGYPQGSQGYNAGYNPNYNPNYATNYNAGGYPNQYPNQYGGYGNYNPNYPTQYPTSGYTQSGYDPQASTTMNMANPQGTNITGGQSMPTITPTTQTQGQMNVNPVPTQQQSSVPTGYGQNMSYPQGYGTYPGMTATDYNPQAYMGYTQQTGQPTTTQPTGGYGTANPQANVQGQGKQQYSGMPQQTTQMPPTQQDDQGGAGPMKPSGNKKHNIEQRYYTPY